MNEYLPVYSSSSWLAVNGPKEILPAPIARKEGRMLPVSQVGASQVGASQVGASQVGASQWSWGSLGIIFITGGLAYWGSWYWYWQNLKVAQWLDIVTRYLRKEHEAGRIIPEKLLVAHIYRPIAEIADRLVVGDYQNYNLWQDGLWDATPESRRRRAEKLVNNRLKEFGYDINKLSSDQKEELTEQTLNMMTFEKAGKAGRTWLESSIE